MAKLIVTAASKSFHRAFDLDSAGVQGRPLLELGTGEWDMPKLRSFLKAALSATAELDAYEIDLKRAGQAGRRWCSTPIDWTAMRGMSACF
jgi:hypothetical protein